MNRRKAAMFLFGAVILLGAGYIAYAEFIYDRPQAAYTVYPGHPNCADIAEVNCANSESFNVSEMQTCRGSIRDLPFVEDVNESTGIVTCKTD